MLLPTVRLECMDMSPYLSTIPMDKTLSGVRYNGHVAELEEPEVIDINNSEGSPGGTDMATAPPTVSHPQSSNANINTVPSYDAQTQDSVPAEVEQLNAVVWPTMANRLAELNTDAKEVEALLQAIFKR